MDSGRLLRKAILDVYPEDDVAVFPLADGGEGTVDAMVQGLHGRIVPVTVTGPLGTKIESRYGLLPDTKTAVIEMADASGLTLVPPEKRNPLHTTTYGLGELIRAALDDGCRRFIIGIGGSATNDCGLGMLTALGFRFQKADGSPAGIKAWTCSSTTFDVVTTPIERSRTTRSKASTCPWPLRSPYTSVGRYTTLALGM